MKEMTVYLNRVRYTICEHAKKRMRQRGITRTDIQSCLNDYDVSLSPARGYSLYIVEHPNGKRLQVIANTADKEIVSVVWLD